MTVIQAFSLEQASRLTGVSVPQLRNWDKSGFFIPAMASTNRREAFSRIYSFKDLASLKVISTLRNETKVSMQHLREVGKKLSGLGENAWSRVTLYVLNRRVVFHNPDTAKKEDIISGQAILDIPLEVVRANMQAEVDLDRRRSQSSFGVIDQRRYIAHSQKVFSGTRIPIRAVQSFLAAGYTARQIIEEYPSLSEQDIDAVRNIGNAA
jgi:DNA-binding transcriptional MerR regulator